MVDLYLKEKLPFEKLELILGREDALAVRASEEVMEQGEELAKKLT